MELTDEERRARQRKYHKKWLENPGAKEKRRASWKRFREKHRERRNAKMRERWANRTPEQIECARNYKKDWAAKNDEALRQKRRMEYEANPEKYRLSNLRNRARKAGIPFNLEEADIKAPEFCPVLGIRLQTRYTDLKEGKYLGPQANSPTVDRIVPELGYVKGNIIVVSHLANRIRQNVTPHQIRLVALFYEALLKKHERVKEINEVTLI